MAEQLLLDPVAEDATNVELDVMAGSYGVSAMSFSAPPLDLVTVSSVDTDGAIVSARGDQNRSVQLTVEVAAASQTALDAAVATLEAKVAKLRLRGGTLRRVRADGTFRTADVLAADSYDKVMDTAYMVGNLAVCQISLVCKPLFRGPEVSIGTFSETTLPTLTFTATVAGDVPALGRLRITDTQVQDQYAFWWGLENRYYDATTSLLYQAESMALRTGWTASADATASGGNKISKAVTGTSYLEAAAFSTAATHVGTYRILVRAKSTSALSAFAFAYNYSDDNAARSSASVVVGNPVIAGTAGSTDWTIFDLGLVRIPKAPLGAQSWVGRLWVAPNASATIHFDYLWLVPAEVSGTLKRTFAVQRAAILAGWSTEVRSDQVTSQDTLTSWNPANGYEGDNLRVPTGTSRFTLKTSRPTSVAGTDSAIDDVSAQLWVTPRYIGMT